MDDSLTAERLGQAPSSIRHLLRQTPGGAGPEREAEPEALPPLDGLTPLPRPGDPYKAHARPANQMLPTLHCLLGDASMRGFSYVNLDSIDWLASDEPGGGPVIVLRFAGITATEVRISGRRLDHLHNYLSHHRIGWVRELPPQRDFLAANEPAVTGICIRRIEPEG